MLDLMFLVVKSIVGFKRHAVIAHSLYGVSAEFRIPTARNFAVSGSPINVNGIFLDSLPYPGRFRASGGSGSTAGLSGRTRRRTVLGFIRYKNQIGVPSETLDALWIMRGDVLETQAFQRSAFQARKQSFISSGLVGYGETRRVSIWGRLQNLGRSSVWESLSFGIARTLASSSEMSAVGASSMRKFPSGDLTRRSFGWPQDAFGWPRGQENTYHGESKSQE
jgi:hypothetical protein